MTTRYRYTGPVSTVQRRGDGELSLIAGSVHELDETKPYVRALVARGLLRAEPASPAPSAPVAPSSEELSPKASKKEKGDK